MKWALVWLFWLFLVKNSQSIGFSNGDSEEDPCEDISPTYCNEKNTFHDHQCAKECHHETFKDFLTTAPEIGKFKKCCDQYSFENNCPDEKGVWNNKTTHPRLCGAPGNLTNFR